MTVPIPSTRQCTLCNLQVTTGSWGECVICGDNTVHLRSREVKQPPRYEGGHDADVPILEFVCPTSECQEEYDR